MTIRSSLYRKSIGEREYQRLLDLSAPLRGARILHVNSSPVRGGVAEILRSEVPLLNSLGIKAERQVIPKDDKYFKVTKKIHNLFHGAEGSLSKADKAIYEAYGQKTWKSISFRNYDFAIIHDPQPLSVLYYAKASGLKVQGKWFWRCHIPIAPKNKETWQFLKPYVESYDGAIFTLDEYVPRDLKVPVTQIYPGIDPLGEKNKPIDQRQATRELAKIHIDAEQPFIAQVSRLDRLKDLPATVEMYRSVRKRFLNLRLVLACNLAVDDPEGKKVFDELSRLIKKDPGISLVVDPKPIELNAIQSLAKVVIQKSIKEGFALTVTEAMWKGTPVIGGDTGGIRYQIEDGKNGFLVSSVKAGAKQLIWLLSHEKQRRQMGERAHKSSGRFLLPISVTNELEMFSRAARN